MTSTSVESNCWFALLEMVDSTMRDFLHHAPAVIGIGLIAFSLILSFRKPVEGNALIAMLIIGAALLLLSDQGILNFKLGASGVEVTRKELQAAKESAAVDFAKIQRDLSDHAKLLDEQKNALKRHQQILESLTQRTGDTAASATLKSTTVVPALDKENSKYVVLVFYRDGQRTTANKIVDALLREGYQSSATNTDLREVIAPIAGDRHRGRIVIAAASAQLPPLDDIVGTVTRVAAENGLEKPELNDGDWTFRRGDVQIYLF